MISIKKTSFLALLLPLLNNWILKIKAHHSAGPLGQDGEEETVRPFTSGSGHVSAEQHLSESDGSALRRGLRAIKD